MAPAADSGFTLPLPAAAALAHSARLSELIRAEIDRAGGSLPFARYMELALYAPDLGYYRAGTQKFGAGGDFITAPELSPLFSRCLARQCAEVLAGTGGAILELGAGSGIMAADLLWELERRQALPAQYLILELSGELRARQQETLAARVPHLLEKIHWLDRLPSAFTGIMLGNEVLDALPVTRFTVTAQGPRPLHVTWDGQAFGMIAGPADPALTAAIALLDTELGTPLPPGYTSEINLHLPAWIATLADALTQGVLLLIDYGYPRREYYHPQRTDGTLLCHYRQRAHHDPLLWPGVQDITASVDFTAVAEAALAAGLEVSGYTSQAYFLFGSGLEELMAASDPGNTLRHLALAQQVKRLTLPGEMGERFKAIALSKQFDGPLCGFSVFDERGRL